MRFLGHRSIRPLSRTITSLTVLALASCVAAPRQSITLADLTAEQLSSIKASHLSFVRMYYAGMREDASDFVADVWMPAFIDSTLAGDTPMSQRVLADLKRSYPLLEIEPDAVNIDVDGESLDPEVREALRGRLRDAVLDARGEFGEVMMNYSEAVHAQVERRRRTLLDPLDEQEALVLREISAAYADLEAGQAALRGYLESVADVKTEQDKVLRKIGILDERDAAMGILEKGARKVDRALRTSGDVERAIDDFNAALDEIRDRLGG